MAESRADCICGHLLLRGKSAVPFGARFGPHPPAHGRIPAAADSHQHGEVGTFGGLEFGRATTESRVDCVSGLLLLRGKSAAPFGARFGPHPPAHGRIPAAADAHQFFLSLFSHRLIHLHSHFLKRLLIVALLSTFFLIVVSSFPASILGRGPDGGGIQFEECGDATNPTLGMEVGKT